MVELNYQVFFMVLEEQFKSYSTNKMHECNSEAALSPAANLHGVWARQKKSVDSSSSTALKTKTIFPPYETTVTQWNVC